MVASPDRSDRDPAEITGEDMLSATEELSPEEQVEQLKRQVKRLEQLVMSSPAPVTSSPNSTTAPGVEKRNVEGPTPVNLRC